MKFAIRYSFALLFTLAATSLVAQTSGEITENKQHTKLNLVKDSRFRFPEFVKGTIYSANKKAWPIARLNYDFYLEQMVYIDEKGDTNMIKDLSEFRYFKKEEKTFIHIHYKGYYEVLADDDSMKLCVNEIYRIKSFDNYGDFSSQKHGTNNSGTASGAVLEKKHFYYLTDKEENFMKADLHNFQRLFPSHKEEIKSFAKSRKTDFRSRDDLEALFNYCVQLGNKKVQHDG